MLEFGRSAKDLQPRPSGVPFIEMLESFSIQRRSSHRPSGVPFIEMLESNMDEGYQPCGPSGVPFIEMLESLILF